MIRIFSALVCILAAGFFLHVNSAADSSCITIDSPRQGMVITTPLCTVAVTACDRVSAISFAAHFLAAGGAGDTSLFLGRITHPPFKLIWNTDAVPNQLYKGMSFSVDAVLRGGERISPTVSGVFLANKPSVTPLATIPWSSSDGYPLFARTMSDGRGPLGIHVSAWWNRDGIRFIARAEAPAVFKPGMKEKLGDAGIEICIDPRLSRNPFPPPDAFSLVFPLAGKPFTTRYRPLQGPQGSFDIATTKEPCECPFEITMDNRKGFTASVLVPASLFGSYLPDSFGCNVIARLPGDNDQIVRLSWIDAPSFMAFSPFVWASVVRLEGPLYGDIPVLGLLSFGAGLALALVVGLVVRFMRRRSLSFAEFEQSEEEKTMSDQIYQVIDETVTTSGLTLAQVAEKLGMPPRRVEKLIRKHKGKTFREFILFLRTEIAKERLRSSHSNAPSIAESCGFKNVAEMEKCFKKFCRTTPARFRRENQVT